MSNPETAGSDVYDSRSAGVKKGMIGCLAFHSSGAMPVWQNVNLKQKAVDPESSS